jgi:hypothetical protein
MRARPSEARRRPASCCAPASGGQKGRGVHPAARLALAGRVCPSPPPPDWRARALAQGRLARASAHRPRAAKGEARGRMRIADALTKPNAHTRVACVVCLRPLAHAAGAADRASGQARTGRASSREVAAGGGEVGERTCQWLEGGAWCPLCAHTKSSGRKPIRGARGDGRGPRVGGFSVSGRELWVCFTSHRVQIRRRANLASVIVS